MERGVKMNTAVRSACFPPAKCELFKLLRVIGEEDVQTIIPVEVTVPNCPDNLVKIEVKTANETFHVFTNKVVKQGVLVITALITTDRDKDGCRCACETFKTTVPFMAVVEIPGVCPNKEVDIQFKDVLLEHDLEIVDGVLTGKVHLIERIKVSEFVQRFLQTCADHVVKRLTGLTPVTQVITSFGAHILRN